MNAEASQTSGAPARVPADVGVVVIGRNEAPRLDGALAAVIDAQPRLVYVDSESSDSSAEIAERRGVHTIRLTGEPRTAARGRQAGFEALRRRFPDLAIVQFVDGDSELQTGWLETGANFLRDNPDAAVVVGHFHEKRIHESLLARLVDVDWDLPVGRVDAVGGIVMVRADALEAVGGWSIAQAAGEELDLSTRLRNAAWSLHRLESQMAVHDIGINTWGELWSRAVRSGVAYADLAVRYGRQTPRWIRRAVGFLAYGLVVPILAIALLAWRPLLATACLLPYIVLMLRMAWWRRRRGDGWSLAIPYGAVTILYKFAGAVGVLRYVVRRIAGRGSRLMEYKSSRSAVS